MSLLYNPKTRKPTPVAITLCLLLPVILIAVVYIWGKGLSGKMDPNPVVEEEKDIFAR